LPFNLSVKLPQHQTCVPAAVASLNKAPAAKAFGRVAAFSFFVCLFNLIAYPTSTYLFH
jgi:hypothetical protein